MLIKMKKSTAVVPCCPQFTRLFKNSIKMDEMMNASTLAMAAFLIILNQFMICYDYQALSIKSKTARFPEFCLHFHPSNTV